MTKYYYVNDVSVQLSKIITKYDKCMVLVDNNISQNYSEILDILKNEYNFIICQIPSSEACKSIEMVKYITNEMLENELTRKSCLVSMGGGVIGDLGGFSSSIFMRGIEHILIPTSLLAMVDSSTGGKTAVDTYYGKNLLGSFSMPSHILINVTFLETLPDIEFSNGMAEIIKMASTSNITLWNKLQNYNITTLKLNHDVLCDIIKLSINTKYSIIEQDPNDNKGIRNILNFGHTIGHGIEAVSGISHGKSVAIGMSLETKLTVNNTLITPFKIRHQILTCLRNYNLPTDLESVGDLDIYKIVNSISKDKKGKCVIAIKKLGESTETIFLNNSDFLQVLTKKRKITMTPLSTKKKISIQVPGSKSITNRVLLIAAICNKKCEINNVLISDDTMFMINALEQLGIEIEFKDSNTVVINGGNGLFNSKNTNNLYLGNSGTSLRFLTGVLATCLKDPHKIVLTGEKRMTERPIGELLDIFINLKSNIHKLNDECPPFEIVGSKNDIEGGDIYLDNLVSSQYVSSLLMASPFFKKTTNVYINKDSVSKGFIDLTYEIMKDFGADINKNTINGKIQYTINPKQYIGLDKYCVEGDATAYCYPIIMSLLSNQSVSITNFNRNSYQSDKSLILSILDKLNVIYKIHDNILTILSDQIIKHSGELDFDSSDTFMTFAVLFASTNCNCTISNVKNQNVKECKRINAICKELGKIGVEITETNDSLTIKGTDKKIYLNGSFKCYLDHRMAMSLSLLSTRCENINLEDIECVNKTYPEYWNDMKKFGMNLEIPDKESYFNEISSKPIVLIGLPSSGKTTLGRYLSEKLNYNYYDTDKCIEKKLNSNGFLYNSKLYKTDNQEFRYQEFLIFRELIKNNSGNTIISTGGGIIENPHVINILKTLPIVIYLERDINHLDNIHISNIASAKGSTVNNLIKTRIPIYESACSHIYHISQKEFIKIRFLRWFNGIYRPFVFNKHSHFLSFGVGDIGKNIKQLQTDCYYDCIDAVELRADLLSDHSIDFVKTQIYVLQNITYKPIIFTYRTIDEGGEGLLTNKLDLLLLAIKMGCSCIDIELSNNNVSINKKHASFIGSCHIDNIDKIVKSLLEANNYNQLEHLKLVITKQNWDILCKLNLPIINPQKITLLLKDKKISRINNEYLTPVISNSLPSTFKNQLTIQDNYQIKTHLDLGKKYYLFGKDIQHSQSPTLHNNWFQEHLAFKKYSLLDTSLISDIKNTIESESFGGASVTMPFKEEVFPFITDVSEDASNIGAVNTITKVSNNIIRGDNTDWMGVQDIILSNTDKSSNLYGIVIGSGGVAKASCYAFKTLNIDFDIYCRTREKGIKLHKQFNGKNVIDINLINSELNYTRYNNYKLIIIICIPGDVYVDLSLYDNSLIIEQSYGSVPNRRYPCNSKVIEGDQVLLAQAKYQKNIWMGI